MTGYYDTFIVKIWRDGGMARGHIQHVATKEYTYFLSVDKMVDFMVGRLGLPENEFGMPGKIHSSWPVAGADLEDSGSDE